ncbi:MAG TPA: hypothetical protein V6D28_26780 [Leptolyngbyaceae cyanobacterium]
MRSLTLKIARSHSEYWLQFHCYFTYQDIAYAKETRFFRKTGFLSLGAIAIYFVS